MFTTVSKIWVLMSGDMRKVLNKQSVEVKYHIFKNPYGRNVIRFFRHSSILAENKVIVFW